MATKTKLVRLVACVALLSVSRAEASTYDVSISDVSGTVSVTGTITTDGTIGVLSRSNITDYNLVLNVGAFSDFFINKNCLTPCTSPIPPGYSFLAMSGQPLSATATSLSFNFGDTSFSWINFDGEDNSILGLLNSEPRGGEVVPQIFVAVCDDFGCSSRVTLSPVVGNPLDEQNELQLLASPAALPAPSPVQDCPA